MSIDAHEPPTSAVRRRRRRRTMPWTGRLHDGGRTAFRAQQVAAIGVAIGMLVAVTDTGAQAGIGGRGGGRAGSHTSSARRAELASLRALKAARFDTPASQFDPRRVHRGRPLTPPSGSPTTTTTTPPPPPPQTWPVGIADASQPSGMAPPAADAMSGYTQRYVSNFPGASLPSGWDVFTGNPGGDPGAQWGASHVTVSGGILSLNTWKDPAYGDEWVAGGLCQCGLARTYGAYFVRSRVTGSGPTQVELLWPTGQWPPEIDFNETDGGVAHTTATVHFGKNNGQDQKALAINMTQWHTWGVVWTPTSIIYTVDGREWGSVHVTAQVPDVPMTLDLTQQTWCSSFWACPTAPESLQVDWVAEYATS